MPSGFPRRIGAVVAINYVFGSAGLSALASALVLIAGAVVDNGEREGSFGIFWAFQIFGWITAAYILSRGLAKIGVRHHNH